jgi:DNA gyrase subunit A
VIATIADLLDILAKPARIQKIIETELRKLKEEFADKRRARSSPSPRTSRSRT